MAKRKAYRITEEESKKQLRMCKICEVLKNADCAVVEVSDKDMDSFIVMGLAMGLGVRTLPIALARFDRKEFAWAEKIVECRLDALPALETKLSQFMQSLPDRQSRKKTNGKSNKAPEDTARKLADPQH